MLPPASALPDLNGVVIELAEEHLPRSPPPTRSRGVSQAHTAIESRSGPGSGIGSRRRHAAR